MLRPLDLLLFIRNIGGDLVLMDDAFIPACENVYGTSTPDSATMLGMDCDFRILVQAGWLARYQSDAGDYLHVRPAGHAMLAHLDAVDAAVQAGTPTPYGDAG